MIRLLAVVFAVAVLAILWLSTTEHTHGPSTARTGAPTPAHAHHHRKPAGRPHAALSATATPTGPAGCHVQRKTVRIPISAARWPDLARHDRQAEKTHPRILHLDRPDADLHRSESLKNIATAPGMDRDEYPPAESREGGTGADVMLVPAGENRSEGSVRRGLLANFCDTQKFRLVVVP